jgi:hypothetical protein
LNKKGFHSFIQVKIIAMKRMYFLNKWMAVALLLFSFTACDDDDEVMEPPTAKAMVVHASPDAPAVDLYVDNTKVNTAALAYPANTGYLTVNAGNRNIKVNPTGTNTAVINADVNFMQGNAYSIFAYNNVAQISPLVLVDDLTTPAAGKTHLRFLHLSPNAPAVTVGVLNGATFTPVFSNRSFETAATATANQGFTPVDAGTYTFQVRLAADGAPVLTIPDVTLQAGKIYTVFARGIVGNTNTPLGAEIIAHN